MMIGKKVIGGKKLLWGKTYNGGWSIWRDEWKTVV